MIKTLHRLWLACLCCIAITLAIFAFDLVFWAKDQYYHYRGRGLAYTQGMSYQHVNGYVLMPSTNNANLIAVKDLVYESATHNQATIQFTLVNQWPTNDYPSLMVLYFDEGGRPMAKTIFSNAQYRHETDFLLEPIRLDITIPAGMGRLEVRPFYPQADES